MVGGIQVTSPLWLIMRSSWCDFSWSAALQEESSHLLYSSYWNYFLTFKKCIQPLNSNRAIVIAIHVSNVTQCECHTCTYFTRVVSVVCHVTQLSCLGTSAACLGMSLVCQWPSTEGSCHPTLDVRHFRRDAVVILPGQGQGSAWRYFHNRCTDLHQSDGRILHLLSALLYGGGSETPNSVSAEVLFTGPPAHVHPTGVPRRVAPVHLNHVQRLLATRSAPWITERSDRNPGPQGTRSWSGWCQELPSDLKLDIHLQGHRTDCRLAADGLPSDEQAPSGPPISLQTGTFHGDGSSQNFLQYPGRSWLGSGDAARIARPECSLRHCRPRHPPDKATKVVRCRWNSTCMDFIIHPRSTAIRHFQRPSIRTDSSEIRRAAGISLGTSSRIGWSWTPTKLNSCGLDPDSSWRRST